MATVHDNLGPVHSYPWRPEFGFLRYFLATQGYTAEAREAIVAHAAEEGTLEGAPFLEPADQADAEEVYVGGMDEVRQCGSEWGGARGFESQYIREDDVWTTTPLGEDPISRDMDAENAVAAVAPISGGAPLPEPYEPTPEDWEDYHRHCREEELREGARSEEDSRHFEERGFE